MHDDKKKNFLENGKFAPGNKITRASGVPTAIRRMFKERRSFSMQLWEGFQLKTEAEINEILENPDIPVGHKIFGEFFLRLKRTASLPDLQLYFGMTGLKPEYIDDAFKPEEGEESSQKRVLLNKTQKLEMLEKAKKIIEDE